MEEQVKRGAAVLPGTFQRPAEMSDLEWQQFCAERGLVSMTVEEFSKIGEAAEEKQKLALWKKRRARAFADRKTAAVLANREKAKLARKARKKSRR